jgi:hypothetical protein
VAIDDGAALSYTALNPGIPVYGSDEVEAGRLGKVLDNAREHIFDGIEVDRRDGARVFVDAPEVARTAERGVTLNITAAELDAYTPLKRGALPSKPPGGVLGRLFRR